MKYFKDTLETASSIKRIHKHKVYPERKKYLCGKLFKLTEASSHEKPFKSIELNVF